MSEVPLYPLCHAQSGCFKPFGVGGRFKNNYFAEMCSGSEEGSYLKYEPSSEPLHISAYKRLYHPTLGSRVIKKNKGR